MKMRGICNLYFGDGGGESFDMSPSRKRSSVSRGGGGTI